MSWLGGRTLRAVLVSVIVVMVAAAGIVLWNSSRSTPAGATVVSLTFDDSTSDQAEAVKILDRHGVKGTFYTISGYVDTPGYLSRGDLLQMQKDGHEIGGHTVLHVDLSQVDTAEARREICIDRRTLQDWGLEPVSFAYPYGSQQLPALAALARDCGYSSARDLGNLRSVKGCELCAYAESLPPADPFQIRTPAGVDPTWSLEDLKAQVVNAQRVGGGWVPLVFHRVCNGCSSISVRPDVLEAFVSWLKSNEASGIEVRTMSEMVKGNDRKAPKVPFGIPSESPPNQAFAAGPDGQPACWSVVHNGQNDARVQTVPAGDGGRPVMQLTVDNFVDGDAKMLPTMDLGACSLYAQPNVTYTLGARYRSDATPQFVLYTRGATGNWSYWTSGPFMDSSRDWRSATFTTPPTPPGTTGLSWGLGLTTAGSVSVVEYGMTSNAPPLPAGEISGDDGEGGFPNIGLWGFVACLLLLLGLWWLIERPVKRLIARLRGPAPPADESKTTVPEKTPTAGS